MDARREKLVMLEKELLDFESKTTVLHVNERPETGEEPLLVSPSIRSRKVLPAGDQLDEKARLMMLEQKYAALIKSYRESQASK